MKIKSCFFAFLMITIVLFGGCSSDVHPKIKLKIVGSFAVPGMFHRDLKGMGSTCEVLEEDSYGRVLFQYQAENFIAGEWQTAVVISQKSDKEYVYFYEDICYYILDNSEPDDQTEDHHDADTERLKEQNDWEKPYDESKMSRRRYSVTFDNTIVIKDSNPEVYRVCRECTNALEIEKDQLTNRALCDVDGKGKALYWILVERNGAEENYFAIADISYNVVLCQITDKTNYFSELVQFKQENNWGYGCQIETAVTNDRTGRFLILKPASSLREIP